MNTPAVPRLSVIIPVLHLKRPVNPSRFFVPRYTLKEVLQDLQTNLPDTCEVIVVCNSRDEDLLQLVTSHPRVDKYCLNSVNVGVSRAWNMGAGMAEGDALCFLNDDVAVGPGAMAALLEALARDNVGQVGPRGARWKQGAHDRFVGEQEVEEADAISGFLFLIRAGLFRSLGGFDVNYSPAGFEEIDMSFAIRRAGRKCLVVPGLDVKHYHHHGVSAYRSDIQYLGHTIDSTALHERNKAYFMKKWGLDAG